MQQDYLQIRVMELAPQVFVSGQLFESDVKLLAKQGVLSIVNTRADNESPGQPLSAELAKVADEYGVTFVHFPLEPGPVADDALESFAKAVEDLKRPLHLFSRTGGRAMKYWETAERRELL